MKYLNLNLDTTLGGENASDVDIASQKATKIYVDNAIAGTSFSIMNPELSPTRSTSTLTWNITHNLGTENVICNVWDGSELATTTVEVTSKDSVAVKLKSNTVIPANTYKATIVTSGATLEGASIIDPALSPTSDNAVRNSVITTALNFKLDKSEYVVDSALSSTSTNPLQNKVIYPCLKNFLPAYTTIEVRQDGTGDFTTIQDAINYLNNKWSDAHIRIHVGAGNYTIPNTLSFDSAYITATWLEFYGDGQNNTIIEASSSFAQTVMFQTVWGISTLFRDLTFKQGSAANPVIGLHAATGSNMSIQNCTFDGFNSTQVLSQGTSRVLLSGDLNFKNFSTCALQAEAGYIASVWDTTLNFENTVNQGIAFGTSYGGQIHITGNNTMTYNNVYRKVSQTAGTASSNGWITGVS